MNPAPDPIYLDYNASTPHAPEVVAAMRPFLEAHFGNPSSAHAYGRRARRAVAEARAQVAELLGCAPEEVVFTSGGTEANNHALRGVVEALDVRGRHLITSQIEHPAVLEVCRWLEARGCAVSYLPVDEGGRVRAEDVAAALRPETALISIMHANNEVGTVQPLAAIAAIALEGGVAFHTDAAQSIGKLPTRVDELGVDLLSVAGHKVYAPKGVGALYVRAGTPLAKLMHGAGHEDGRRPGTENVLEIVGLGAACALAADGLEAHAMHMTAMRDRLHAGLSARLDVRLNGHPEHRLPNTFNASLAGVRAGALLETIGERVAASAGAACHADQVHVSHVLRAMGLSEARALGALRLSVGRPTTAAEIDAAVEAISAAAEEQTK